MPPLRRSRVVTDAINPLTRLSEHFILADFLGNQTVYTKGLVNSLIRDKAALQKIDNVTALCVHGLEPILAEWGPLSVSYGYIAPATSQAIVRYQDPAQPSHHRFDLGAAADICVHRFVAGQYPTLDDLFLPPTAQGSPIALAHGIDQLNIPYSRLITYSESPYICLAVSSTEVYREQPRKAFYENRYQGRKGEKPEYIQLPNQNARNRHFEQLQDQGLEHDWQGHGYPTYHGGGRRQYQHMRVSKYTMVSDWLLDLQSIAAGAKNIPALNKDAVQDAFAACGTVYDFIVDTFDYKRLSIVRGYVDPINPYFDSTNDWRGNEVSFDVVPPASAQSKDLIRQLSVSLPDGAYAEKVTEGQVRVHLLVDAVLENDAFSPAPL